MNLNKLKTKSRIVVMTWSLHMC